MTRRWRWGVLFGSAALITAAIGGVQMANRVAEPAYEVLTRYDGFELRQYAPYVVAETRVEGEYRSSLNTAFRRLAGYIFGGNRSQKKFAMTAPVSAQAAATSEKIAMTAPVSAQKESGGWLIAFVMPAGSQLETMPVPNDARVTLRQLSARRVAALRFRGWARASDVEKKTAELFAALQPAKLTPAGAPVIAQYNPPWTLPFLRRNEILIDVAN